MGRKLGPTKKPECSCAPAEMTWLGVATNDRGIIYHCKQHGGIKVIKPEKEETK